MFTIENEVNQEIPFLDMKIMRQLDGSTKFTIHRKDSYTGKLLDFRSSSHH